MVRTADVQTFGAILAFAAFGSAAAALHLLDAYPGSAFAWYLNLEVFHLFGALRLRASPLEPLFGPSGLLIVGGLIASAVVARVANARIVTAFLANLGFACVVLLLYCRFEGPTGIDAAVIPFERLNAFELLVAAVLLTTSLSAFLASHAAFLIEVARECIPLRRAVLGLDDRSRDAGLAPSVGVT